MSDTSSTITLSDTSSIPKLASQQTHGLDAKDSASTSSQQQEQQTPPHTPEAQRFTLEDRDFLDNISKTLRTLDDELQTWRRRVDERDYKPRTAREAELDARFQAGWQAVEEADAIRQAQELREWQAWQIERDVRYAQNDARSAALDARLWSPEEKRQFAAWDAADDEAVCVALEAAGLGSEVRRGGGSGGAGSSIHGQGQRQAGA